MKQHILIFLFSVSQLFLFAQKCDKIMEGDSAVQNAKLGEAIQHYIIAATINCSDDEKKKAIQRIITVCQDIDNLEIKKQGVGSMKKNSLVLKLKKSDQLFTSTLNQLFEEQRKNKKLINAIYFYKNRFAIAYENNKFHFIDKKGDKVLKLQEWDHATLFDWSGFAKVRKHIDGVYQEYLLDTLGNDYLLVYDTDQLTEFVTALDLSRQVHVDKKFYEFNDLKILSLNNNRLSYLDAAIKQLNDLRYLDLHGNSFKKFPAELKELKEIKHLNLSDNLLKEVPVSISSLENLVTLNLSSNLLTELPNQISQLKKLTTLDLSGNLISEAQLAVIRDSLPWCKVEFKSAEKQSLAFKYSLLGEYSKAYHYQKMASEKYKENDRIWWSLSWYACLTNHPQEAIDAAKKTLELNPKSVGVETNLALGYLLNNQWPEAAKIYMKWKGEFSREYNRLYDDVFRQDLKDLQNIGVTHPDFKKVRQLLK